MTNQQQWKQAAKNYRDFPLMDAKFIDSDTRADVKDIFTLLLSRDQLKASIKEHLLPINEFSEDSPFLATLNTRLQIIERRLDQHEGKYGKLYDR